MSSFFRGIFSRMVHVDQPFGIGIAVLVVGLWLLVTILLGFAAGHMLLLSRFPPVAEPESEHFPFASGSMRFVSFGNALQVGIGARGLHLAPGWLFRPATHRAVPCIPWSELRCLKRQAEASWFMRASAFEIPRIGMRFRLRGQAGEAVEAALARAGGLTRAG